MSSAEEGRECSRGVACLHRVKLTEQDSGPEHGKGGIMGEIPRGCLVSVAVINWITSQSAHGLGGVGE